MVGSVSQVASARTPPQGPSRSFFGHAIGQMKAVSWRMHFPHISQPNSGRLIARSSNAIDSAGKLLSAFLSAEGTASTSKSGNLGRGRGARPPKLVDAPANQQ